MARKPLHVPSFGGGVVLFGSPDTQEPSELQQADGFDIGPRGALIAAAGPTNYLTLNDVVPVPWSRVLGLVSAVPGFRAADALAVGEGIGMVQPANPSGPAYLVRSLTRQFGTSGPLITLATPAWIGGTPPQLPATEGAVVTGFTWPGVFTLGGVGTMNIALMCLGAREGMAPRENVLFGLWVVFTLVGSPISFGASPIQDFDALGTGPFGEFVGGADAQQLFFRGIIGYNNFVLGWGFDSADATNGDGPCRVMFCNAGNPLKWGNDNQAAAGANRHFTDSDAIILGDAGEIVRGALVIFGRCFFGTNRGLHYIGGFGRDSFLTDGSTPVMRAYNIVGPHALIEGPDKLLYGVSDHGLWNFDGQGVPNALFNRLHNYDNASPGYWDLIWTDATRSPTDYPGPTNQDLVWMAIDQDRQQVLVGIPFCNATTGSGPGNDTVVVKYHTRTGGFTRQIFPGVQYTAAAFLRQANQQPNAKLVGTATVGQTTIQYFSESPSGVPGPLVAPLPDVTFGPYAPFGPEGRGSLKRLYLTVAWLSAAALPLAWQVTTFIDEQVSDTFRLTIAPVAPVSPNENDLWLDTSLTDANLGNATAGALIEAFPEALLRRWALGAPEPDDPMVTESVDPMVTESSDPMVLETAFAVFPRWLQVPNVGSNGTRATIRLPLSPRNGTRITMEFTAVTVNGRYQIEGLGEQSGGGASAE